MAFDPFLLKVIMMLIFPKIAWTTPLIGPKIELFKKWLCIHARFYIAIACMQDFI